MKGVRFPKSVEPLLVPLDRVQQFPGNPNNGDLDELITSIQVHGFLGVITADANTGYIMAGNHRWQALHALGATHVPVVWAEQALDGGKRFLIGDNKLGQLAEMDEAMELEILKELQDTDLGLAGTGFDEAGLDRLMADVAASAEMPIGGGMEVAPNGIYQVIVEFQDEGERDDLFAELADHFEDKVRTANL